MSTSLRRGERIVQYRGSQFAVIGLYFAVLQSRHHEVYFVLRGDPDQGDAHDEDQG